MVGTLSNDADCDLVVTSEDCDDSNADIINTNIEDADCDLVVSSEDCDDNDPTVTNQTPTISTVIWLLRVRIVMIKMCL